MKHTLKCEASLRARIVSHLSSLRAFPPPFRRRYRIGGLLHRPLPLAFHALPRDFHVDLRQHLEEGTATDLLLQEFHHLGTGKERGGRREVGHRGKFSARKIEIFVTLAATGMRTLYLYLPVEQQGKGWGELQNTSFSGLEGGT